MSLALLNDTAASSSVFAGTAIDASPRPAVLSGLSDREIDAILSRGRMRRVQAGQSIRPQGDAFSGLSLVLEGVACRAGGDTGLCLAVVAPGDALVAQAAVMGLGDDDGVWITNGTVLDASADVLIDVLGPEGLLEIALAVSARRQAALETEFQCCIRHPAARRLARWIHRFHAATGQRELVLSQSRLGTLSGLQRTSVCAAMASLQKAGGLKVIRGRIRIEDSEALRRQACQCDAGSGSQVSGHSAQFAAARSEPIPRVPL